MQKVINAFSDAVTDLNGSLITAVVKKSAEVSVGETPAVSAIARAEGWEFL